jgi:RES domain-containing protein
LTALQLGFRVCDRRYPFLWSGAGQGSGRWNRTGDQPVHYLASTPTVAWAEWIRHQEITDPGDLAGVAAALWAVLIPQEWGAKELDSVALHLDQVLETSPPAQEARLALVGHLKKQGAQGLLAPTAALHDSDRVLPAVRVSNGSEQPDRLAMPAQVILLWCEARVLPGWCCVPEGRPGAELLPLVRREKLLTL